MNQDILTLFDKMPDALPFYEQLEKQILDTFADVTFKVGKTQVSFYNKYGFAWVWPPYRKVKGWPEVYMGVTFGLGHKLEHPRIIEAVQPYPNRWTHHVLVQHEEEIDAQLLSWISDSYYFSLNKR